MVSTTWTTGGIGVKKILVVDDRAEVRDLLERTLARGSYQIFSAGNGQEAVALARDEAPDLIVMDIMMPGDLNGTEATRILKSDPQTRVSKVMILTGKEGAQVVQDATNAGADVFVAKPFSPLELLQKIDELLG